MASTARLALVIGCSALLHRGHQALVDAALAEAGRVVVLLGSAFHARTPRDPFTWREREAMVRLCIAPGDQERVRFAPLRDYSDDARWVEAVGAAVRPEAGRSARVVLVHPGRDAARYEAWFPRWERRPVDASCLVDSTRLRCIYLRAGSEPRFTAERIEGTLAALSEWVPAPVLEYLRAWTRLPFYAELAADQKAIDEERARWNGAPYEPIFTTVDALVTCSEHVLLVQRKRRPGQGLWALPGGFLDPGERLLDGVLRELAEETGLASHGLALRRALRRVAVFDHPARSQRGRIITHAHHFELRQERPAQVKGGDDAACATWMPVAQLAALEERFFEDHFHILDEFLRLTG